MMTLSNALSLLRGPLAFFLLWQNAKVRASVILLAMLTDGLDGFLARRTSSTTRLGAMLDPLMDKFFVFFALCVFLAEGNLTIAQMLAILCRDFAVALFGLYLVISGRLGKYHFQAIWAGKVTTACQFVVLLCLAFGRTVPGWATGIFVFLGVLALAELCVTYSLSKVTASPDG